MSDNVAVARAIFDAFQAGEMEAARDILAQDFVLAARADGLMCKTYDVDEAIRRLQAYEAAGADCLYAPLPATIEDLRKIRLSVTAPLNVLAAGPVYTQLSQSDYAELGIARISLGSALCRMIQQTVLDVGGAILKDGDFKALADAAPGAKIDALIVEQG